MTRNEKNRKNYIGLILFGIAIIVLIVAIIIFIISNGEKTETLEITGSREVSGIRCTNAEKMSFVFDETVPVSYQNIITATFMDDKLSSLSLDYNGTYHDATEADHARDLAEARYNLTMTEQYGLKTTDFSRNISVDNNTIYATITASGSKNLNFKTASLFMLNETQSFPNSLQSMKTAYENAGFVCNTNN